MDGLTHVLLGAQAAHAGVPGRAPLTLRERLLLGGAAAAWPDVDFVGFVVDPLRFLADWHQGPTHALPWLPAWAVLIAGTYTLAVRRPAAFGAAALACSLGLLSHVVADTITAYGTMLWHPLSTRRTGLGIAFVIDPLLSAIVLLGLVAALRWRRRVLSLAALGLLGAYLVVLAGLQQRALAFGSASARAQGVAFERLQAYAQPLSPLHWKLIASDAERHHVAHVDLAGHGPLVPPWLGLRRLHALDAAYQAPDALDWRRHERLGDTPQQRRLGETLWLDARFAPFRRFATHPALSRIDADPPCVWFTDLRYDLPAWPDTFRYGYCRDGGNDAWQLYRLRYFSHDARQRLP